MQINDTMRHQLTTVTKAIIRHLGDNKYWQRCGEKGTLEHCWWEEKFAQPLWETDWWFLKKWKTDLAITLLVPIQRTWNHGPKGIPALLCSLHYYLQRPKPGNNLCPWMDEWIKKMSYVHAVKHYSAINVRNSAVYCNMDGPWGHHSK